MSKPQILWWVIYCKGEVWTEQGWMGIYDRVSNPCLFQKKSDAEDLLEQWKYDSEDDEENLASLNSCIVVPGVFAFPA